MNIPSYRIILLGFAVMLIASVAGAKSIKVSSGGMDSPTCGSGPNPPCASIAQAIDNGADGDSVLVGPGRYAGAAVDKRLRLWSSNGTGGAVIIGPVLLNVDGIVFGKAGKGFSLNPGSAAPAVVVSGNGVTVRGNIINSCSTGVDSVGDDTVVRDNSINACGTAIRMTGSRALVRGNRIGFTVFSGVMLESTSSDADVRDNRMYGPSGTAIIIGGSGHLVRRNLVHGSPGGIAGVGTPTDVYLLQNVVVGAPGPGYYLSAGSGWVLTGNAALDNQGPGFYLTAGSTFALASNIAIGNSSYGILIVGGDDHVLADNTAIDNLGFGIYLASIGTGVSVSGGNLYGNSSNCGLNNDSASPVTADKVFWGAATGPGPNPADEVCGNIPAVAVSRPASKPASIKLPKVK